MAAIETEVVVVGGGLAGLGVATALGEDFGVKTTVLDSCTPKLDGQDRFRPNMAASFKNAGMFDLGAIVPGVKDYFSGKTAELYSEMGVEVREKGAYVLASSMLNELAADALLERVDPAEFQEELEPNVKLAASNEAVLKFSKGSQAEPEATMKILIEKAEAVDNVEVVYGDGVTDLAYDGSAWDITTASGKKYKAARVVIAAGPGSAPLLRKLRYNLPMRDVYGLIAQSGDLEQPWLQGSILGAKSYVFWFMRAFCSCFYGTNPLEATSLFGESKSWTTHLYLNVHNNKIYLGGPRIALPGNYGAEATTPSTYTRDMQETEDYARELVDFPEGSSFELDNTWGGVMAFPKDADYPFVGPLGKEFDNTLFVCTGFASAGFREAYGAGHFLACYMQDGQKKLKARIGKVNSRDFSLVLPSRRARRI